MKLSKNLKELLSKNDLNISQLSRATNVPRQTVDNWLSNQEPRSLKQVKLVADYFSVTVDELCFGSVRAKKKVSSIDEYSDEINAGVFEVVLRRVKTDCQ